ncbi:unnamed protein product [Tuber aestivum]|uniref:F-box domain-containing protein n=1 Tax=Tuber aestivum TaxID=59557 RepID=A0A292PQ44_9PEZI|nr:unnamed protein product [Tuber aestivum]
MLFLEAPNEIILQVSKYQSPPDLCSLLRANRRLANLLGDALLDCALHSISETERYAEGALYSAVIRGDERAAKRLIDGGIFKRLDEKKLLTRILSDHERRWGEKALPTLLACGCDPETRDSEGRTLLALAATNGLFEAVELLMDRDDVDVNSTDTGNNTPLHMAVEVGDYEVVQLLMDDERVDVNRPNNNNRTPLHIAVMMGHDEVVRLLLEHSEININSKDKLGWTPLSYPADAMNPTGYLASVQLLLNDKRIDVNLGNKHRRTPLHTAVTMGHEAVVRLLLGRDDLDVNVRDSIGWTPLSCAAGSANTTGRPTVLQLLLNDHRVDINTKDKRGGTPLHLAVRMGHEAAVRLLLDCSDININVKDISDKTPLAYASGEYETIVQLLMNYLRV